MCIRAHEFYISIYTPYLLSKWKVVYTTRVVIKCFYSINYKTIVDQATTEACYVD